MPFNDKSDKSRAKSKKRRVRKTKKSKKVSNCGSGTLKNDMDIISIEDLYNLTEENSFLLNSAVPNIVFQKDVIFSQERAKSCKILHEYLFDKRTLDRLKDETLVNLYSIAINDLNKSRALNMKLAETSEKSRWFKDLHKTVHELNRQRLEAKTLEKDHTLEMIRYLLSGSMRLALEDELEKKYGGSNSYRPIENKNYEVITIDPTIED